VKLILPDTMQRHALLIITILLAWASLAGCKKDNFLRDPNARIDFSIDTLMFDTVFTTIGTVTKEFRVYNKHNKNLLISSISLAGGQNSAFRINVDGRPGPIISDYELAANDSLYVFVEATIDPLNVNSPLVVQDSVVFVVNDNLQDIDLVAWGQDVHLINGKIVSTESWINDKPYLVYNSMLVDTLETLTIEPGVRIYFHNSSTMYISGTLNVMGTIDEPVIFSGDRLEPFYKDIPGQWVGLYFINGSSQNEIHNAVIMNGTTGIHLGNLYSMDLPPDIRLENVKLEHMTFAGISTIGATVYAGNCLIADCGFYLAALTTGGSYEFNHCTFANYWGWSGRSTPSLLLTNYYNFNDTAIFSGDLTMASFGNSIIYGSKDNEIGLSNLPGAGTFHYFFDHCLVKVDTSVETSDPQFFSEPYANHTPGFISIFESNFQLDTLAYGKDKGSIEIANKEPLDLLGHDRLKDGKPDLGAYERVEMIDSTKLLRLN